MKSSYAKSSQPRWFFTCRTCGHRRQWTGLQSDDPGCPECAKAKAAAPKAGGITIGPPVDDDEVNEALELADEAIELTEELPDRAYDFAVSIKERLTDIRKSIIERDKVTPAQREAIENMKAGIERWLR